MALHKQSDFASLCGKPNAFISTYIKRGKLVKIVKEGDNFIDDTHPLNEAFLRQCTKEKNTPAKSQQDDDPEIEKALKRGDTEYFELVKLKLKNETELQEQKKALQELKLQKEQGIVIPTDLVKDVFGRHNKSIVTAFKEGSDNIITEISKKKELTRAEVAEINQALIKIINDATDKAISETKRALTNIVNEYAAKRGVGERNTI